MQANRIIYVKTCSQICSFLSWEQNLLTMPYWVALLWKVKFFFTGLRKKRQSKTWATVPRGCINQMSEWPPTPCKRGARGRIDPETGPTICWPWCTRQASATGSRCFPNKSLPSWGEAHEPAWSTRNGLAWWMLMSYCSYMHRLPFSPAPASSSRRLLLYRNSTSLEKNRRRMHRRWAIGGL